MAFSEGYRAPRFRDIGLALLIGLVVLIALLKLGDVVKSVGAVFYYIPARLGLVQQAGSGEVQRFALNAMPELVSFPEAGRYVLYTSDYDLLSVSDALSEKQDADPWFTVIVPETGERLPVEFINRGMRIYDSYLAPGRPVMAFTVSRPGFYQVRHPRRPAQIAIARDYVTGNEGRILAVFAAEVAVIAAPFVIVFGGRYWRRETARRRMQRERRAEADAAFRALAERRAVQTDAADPDAPYRPKN